MMPGIAREQNIFFFFLPLLHLVVGEERRIEKNCFFSAAVQKVGQKSGMNVRTLKEKKKLCSLFGAAGRENAFEDRQTDTQKKEKRRMRVKERKGKGTKEK